MRGRWMRTISEFEDEERDNDQDPGGYGGPDPALERGDLRVGAPPERETPDDRSDPSKEIGNTGEVGDDVVAVETDDGK